VTVKKLRKEIFANELGYKDESNPFGDQSLTEKFTWKKKNDYLQAAGLYKKTDKSQHVERIEAKVREIHAVKKRRDEREVERRLLEQQRAEHDKEMHDEEFGEWTNKEETFHMENAQARSIIRIEQGRERPIDLAVKSIAIAEGQEFEEMTILDKPPHQIFAQMGEQECDDMLSEIEIHVKADLRHRPFWKAMAYCCQDALEAKMREKAVAKSGALGAGVAEGVVSDIHDLLSIKDKSELEDMLIEIKADLKKGGPGIDTQFFDAVAQKIPLFIARAEIEQWHKKAQHKVAAWREDHPEDDEDDQPPPPKASPTSSKAVEKSDWADVPDGSPEGDNLSPELEPLSVLDDAPSMAGIYSPVLEPISTYDEQDLLDPDEDARIMRQVRDTLIQAFGGEAEAAGSSGDKLANNSSADNALFEAEARRGISKDEANFNAIGSGANENHGEVDIGGRHYEWEDKYKPRKPRFFNRVKTGYEWNKYNQTHYDHDNPPPKSVQGYKFNIFYPDLIDKTKAPTYFVEKSDDPETVILRFSAGPPYEDVAFKVVNREWNLSHKFGFRVVFDRGVLQLYFNFKRWRYRR